jgi:anti-sigma regulatory factor (Ser/Thr protein kinase)
MSPSDELPRGVDAPSQARHLLALWAGDELAPDELDRAKLVCSELVNNAVLHGEGKIRLQLDLDENRLLIEVIDEGQGFEHVIREVAFEKLSGRGLAIVEAEASRWGVHQGTTHVWAELERAGPRLGEEAKPDTEG